MLIEAILSFTRRRHAADRPRAGATSWPRAARFWQVKPYHRLLPGLVPVARPCSPSTCSATACATRSIRAWRKRCELHEHAALLEIENLQTHFRTRDGVNRAVDGVSLHGRAKARRWRWSARAAAANPSPHMSILRLIPEPPAQIAGSIRFQGDGSAATLDERGDARHPRQRASA